MPKKRTYTGTKDGAAKGKRPGTELFQSLLCKRFDSKNLGTWVDRNMRGKNLLSVHATGRAGNEGDDERTAGEARCGELHHGHLRWLHARILAGCHTQVNENGY